MPDETTPTRTDRAIWKTLIQRAESLIQASPVPHLDLSILHDIQPGDLLIFKDSALHNLAFDRVEKTLAMLRLLGEELNKHTKGVTIAVLPAGTDLEKLKPEAVEAIVMAWLHNLSELEPSEESRLAARLLQLVARRKVANTLDEF